MAVEFSKLAWREVLVAFQVVKPVARCTKAKEAACRIAAEAKQIRHHLEISSGDHDRRVAGDQRKARNVVNENETAAALKCVLQDLHGGRNI